MQIGPKIRVGGSIGKAGQKLKEGAGAALRNPLVLGAAGFLTGGATLPLLLGAAGGGLQDHAGLGDLAGGALEGGLAGYGGAALKGGLMAHQAGASVGSIANAIKGDAGSRLGTAGKFLLDHKRDIADVGQAGEHIYDKMQENKAIGDAQNRYRSLQPLRDQAMAELMKPQGQTDLSAVFADPTNPQGRYRRVNVGSTGGY